MEKGLSKLVVSISRPFSVRNQPVHLCSVCKDVFQEQACNSERCKHLQFVISVFVDDVGLGRLYAHVVCNHCYHQPMCVCARVSIMDG